MVFHVPAPAGDQPQNRFEFVLGPESLGAEILSLPKLEFVPPEADDYLRDAAGKSLPRRDFILGFIEACDPEVGKKVRDARLHRHQIDALYEEWGNVSKVDEGESSASERS